MKAQSFLLIWLLLSAGQPYSPRSADDPLQNQQPEMDTPASASSVWYLTRGEAWMDKGWGVDVDAQGNVYLVGLEQHAGQLFTDIGVYKFSPDGAELWHTPWGNAYTDKGFVVDVAEPYVYVGGLTQSGWWLDTADMVVLKLNTSDGSLVDEFTWGQGYGYEEVDGLVVDGDNLYVSGWTTGETSGGDIAVLELTTDLTLVLTTTWGSPYADEANGHIVVDATSVYVAGYYNGQDAVLVAFDKNSLAYQWHTTWGGASYDDAYGLASDGVNLYVVGLTLSYGNGGQIFLLKYDSTRALEWDRLWGGSGSESARAVASRADGNILVAGKTDSYGSGANDVAFLQYSPDGVLNWQKLWGGSQIDEAHDIVLDGQAAYIAGESSSFSSGQSDILLIKAGASSGQMPLVGSFLVFLPIASK